LIASGYNAGAALIEVQYAGDKWSVREVWRTKPSVMRCKFASPVVHEGTLYGLNDGYLEAVDLGTGKQLWKDDRRRFKPGEAYGHGQLIRVGNHLLALTEYGELVLIETSPKELIEKARLKVLSGRCWNNFAVVDGIIYLRNDREMTAFDLRPGKK
jgi:outer membrane protein assembly factor BamB